MALAVRNAVLWRCLRAAGFGRITGSTHRREPVINTDERGKSRTRDVRRQMGLWRGATRWQVRETRSQNAGRTLAARPAIRRVRRFPTRRGRQRKRCICMRTSLWRTTHRPTSMSRRPCTVTCAPGHSLAVGRRADRCGPPARRRGRAAGRLREPSRVELEIQARTEREIKAAWRSVGTIAAVQQAAPIEKQAPADGPILALGDPQDQTEASTEELKAGAETAADVPVDTRSDATAAKSDVAAAKGDATTDTASAKTEALAAREQAQTTAVHTPPPLAEEPVAAKETGEPRAVARYRHQRAKRGAHVRKKLPAPYTQSESGGQYFRYLTIERVARAAP